jgi:hypothetical protein
MDHIRLNVQGSLYDASVGKEGDYPEIDPILCIYVALGNGVRSSVKVVVRDWSSKRVFPFNVDVSVPLGNLKRIPRGATLCISVFSKTTLIEESDTKNSYQSEGIFCVPTGNTNFFLWRMAERMKTYKSNKISMFGILQDHCHEKQLKGAIQFSVRDDGNNMQSLQFERKEMDITLVDRATESLRKRYREDMKPADPAIAIFQIPHFVTRCGKLNAASFFMQDPDTDDERIESVLVRFLDQSLGINNMTSESFVRAVTTQMSHTDRTILESFHSANKVAHEACSLAAQRVHYMDDHACEDGLDRWAFLQSAEWRKWEDSYTEKRGIGDPECPSSFVKVERFLDAGWTRLGDCEDMARLAYSFARAVVTKEWIAPRMKAWKTLLSLFVPVGVVCSVSLKCAEKDMIDVGNDMKQVCHVMTTQIPAASFHMMTRSAYQALPWEMDLEPAILEGTIPTCPTQKRPGSYASRGDEVDAMVQKVEKTRLSLEQKYPLLRKMDIELVPTNADDAVTSDFYGYMIQVWCPKHFDDIIDMAVCDKKTPDTFGVPFSEWMKPASRNSLMLVPNYVYDHDLRELTEDILSREMPIYLPGDPRMAKVDVHKVGEAVLFRSKTNVEAMKVSAVKLGLDVKQLDPVEYHSSYWKPYVSYRLDPGQFTKEMGETMLKILKETKIKALRWMYREMTDDMTLLEIRLMLQ